MYLTGTVIKHTQCAIIKFSAGGSEYCEMTSKLWDARREYKIPDWNARAPTYENILTSITKLSERVEWRLIKTRKNYTSLQKDKEEKVYVMSNPRSHWCVQYAYLMYA